LTNFNSDKFDYFVEQMWICMEKCFIFDFERATKMLRLLAPSDEKPAFDQLVCRPVTFKTLRQILQVILAHSQATDAQKLDAAHLILKIEASVGPQSDIRLDEHQMDSVMKLLELSSKIRPTYEGVTAYTLDAWMRSLRETNTPVVWKKGVIENVCSIWTPSTLLPPTTLLPFVIGYSSLSAAAMVVTGTVRVFSAST
jgi:hypothetical protein